MFDAISQNEDIIYKGLPGPGFIRCSVDIPGVQISHLNVDGQETLAMLYFPEATSFTDSELASLEAQNIKLDCMALVSGTYNIQVYKNGENIKDFSISLEETNFESIEIENVRKEDILFISIRKYSLLN